MHKKARALAEILSGFLLAALPVLAQSTFPMTEIDEVAHLETDWDDREFADLGLARVYNDGEDGLRVEGRDNEGLPWNMWIERVGGVGATRVFVADFDANGRADLLFSSLFPGNGRCIDGGTITTLLFDSKGRPTPWQISSHGLTNDESLPITLLDLNADGRAEIATGGCRHSDYRLRDTIEDLWLSGVYEARDARWVPIRPSFLDPYVTAVRRRFAREDPTLSYWDESPQEWRDPLAGWDAQPTLHVTGILTAELGCNAAVVLDQTCGEFARAVRLRYSDGKVRLGLPSVVIDSSKGREIHTLNQSEVIEDLLRTRSRLRVLGPDDRPAFLWADVGPADHARPLAARLAVSSSESVPVAFTEGPPVEPPDEPSGSFPVYVGTTPSEPRRDSSESESESESKPQSNPEPVDPQTTNHRFASFLLGISTGSPLPAKPLRTPGTRFSRDGRCFAFAPRSGDAAPIYALPDCAEMGDLESEALRGDRVWSSRFEMDPRALAPMERRMRLVSRLARWNGRDYEIEFQPATGRPGDVIAVAPFEGGWGTALHNGWLAQWQSGLDTWLVLHSRTGEPLSPPISFGTEGELFEAGSSKGIIFLRWQDGIPVEMTTVRAGIEWVRQD